jgi:hypothetical protein
VTGELERRSGEGNRRLVSRHGREALSATDLIGKLFAMFLVEERLWVVKIEL